MPAPWEVYYFEVFYQQYAQLISEVATLRSADPEGYKTHKKTILLARVRSVIRDKIQQDPSSPEFHFTKTLPPEYRAFKRVKKGLPKRLRLFFRYKSSDGKIVIVWMNNRETLRKRGGRKDVYTVFIKMLSNGSVPNNWTSLINKAKLPPEAKKKSRSS